MLFKVKAEIYIPYTGIVVRSIAIEDRIISHCFNFLTDIDHHFVHNSFEMRIVISMSHQQSHSLLTFSHILNAHSKSLIIYYCWNQQIGHNLTLILSIFHVWVVLSCILIWIFLVNSTSLFFFKLFFIWFREHFPVLNPNCHFKRISVSIQ